MALDRRLDALLDNAEALGPQIARHTAKAGALDAFTKYENDPMAFAVEVLGLRADKIEHLRPLVESVRDHRYTAWVTSNAWGKDYGVGRIILPWWVFACRGFAVVTAATERQVKAVVMAEVRRGFLAAAKLPGTLYELGLKVSGPEPIGIIGMTSTESSKLSGFHAPRLLAVLSEAQAIEPECWEGVLSCAAGENDRVLAVGNPLLGSGRFHEVAHSSAWHVEQRSAFQHPNLVLERDVIPGAVTQRFVDMIRDEYGLTSGVYAARVLGQFPDSEGDALMAAR